LATVKKPERSRELAPAVDHARETPRAAIPVAEGDAPLGSRGRAGGPAPDPLELPVLVVNRHFQPVQLTTARRAFVLLYGGVALVLDASGELYDFSAWREVPPRASDDVVPTVSGSIRVPRVLHLRRYERVRRPQIRLSRKNVMLRDGHRCQYCGRSPPLRDLDLDHVQPRSRGGRDSWDNLVTSCRPCNLAKGWHTPEEAGMRLLGKPLTPRWSTAAQILLGQPEPYEEWVPFLRAG
jgi:5-methylcytosine-specific restriction endonuclease McrA